SSAHSQPPAAPGRATLSLHDALPISSPSREGAAPSAPRCRPSSHAGCEPTLRSSPSTTATPRASSGTGSSSSRIDTSGVAVVDRSEEHTSELQSLAYLVCRLLLEKKK